MKSRGSRSLAPVLAFALALPFVTTMTGTAALAATTNPEDVGVIAGFEGGTPPGFFVDAGGGSAVQADTVVVADDDAEARAGQIDEQEVLRAEFSIPDGGWGSFGQSFDDVGPHDLRGTDGFRLWLYGSGSGATLQVEVMASRSDPSRDTSERFDVELIDDVDGWRLVEIPWSEFTRATDWQPDDAPDAGLTLEEIWGWAIPLVATGGEVVTLLFDDVGVIPHRIHDFESPLFTGSDPNGLAIGFSTFSDGASGVSIDTSPTPPAPILSHLGEDNQVLRTELDVSGFAGFVQSFTDGTDWVAQDWSDHAGFGFWFHGDGDGAQLFVDLLGARNPGSTTDDAQRWTAAFVDDTPGWSFVWFAFDDLAWKGIGNGAPTTDLMLDQVHGWAFGAVQTGGPATYYLDDVVLLGSAGERPLTVGFAATNTTVTEGGTANVPVRLSRPLGEDEDPVTVSYATEDGTGRADRDYVPASGLLEFVPGGPSEQVFEVATLDDHKPLGDRTAIVRLSSAEGAPLGTAQGRVTILDDDPRDPALLDDFERGVEFVDGIDAEVSHVRMPDGGEFARPDQAPVEGMLRADVAADDAGQLPVPNPRVTRLSPCPPAVVRVAIHGSDERPVSEIDHTTIRVGDASEMRLVGREREPKRQVEDVDGDGHDDLVVHVRANQTGLTCHEVEGGVTASTWDGEPVFTDPDDSPSASLGGVSRSFPEPRDVSGAEGISFWFHGSGTGDDVTFRIHDDRAPDPGPEGWELVWSDEFEGPAGSPPDPDNWSYEIGDGTANGIPGWGNDELQYYTDDPANVQLDGDGHLVITTKEEDGDLQCYYGPCEYSSARLLTQHKQEFMFGRVEARVQVPQGAGLWPAFWMLGTDIGEVGWPQTGEIDILEFVGREPNEVFGTIHGPGYSGGASFGNTFTTEDPVYEDFHEFAVEWQPGHITWEFNGQRFHEAVPSDVAPNEWVFDHPFFLLLNTAVGGNFGGPVGPDTTFPQETIVDWVRVYAAPDTAERFEATFVDDVDGWRRVEVPFDTLIRSAEQPAGAPDSGLNLTEMWGYELVTTGPASFLLDDVRLLQATEVVVTSAADAGPGSLRAALGNVGPGGTVRIDPSLSGETVVLTSGSLTVDTSLTLDAREAPGFAVDAEGSSRVLTIGSGAEVTMEGLTVTGGSHASRGGAIHVSGSLDLVDVTIAGSTAGGSPDDFQAGGGAIYVAAGARLSLSDVVLADNSTTANGGAVWAGFDSQVTIAGSTLSANQAGNVGGALRTLGDLSLTNSTLSGNTSAWHGAALFHTDGVAEVRSSTIVDNVVPSVNEASVFVGTFGDSSATLEIADSALSGGGGLACIAFFGGSGTITLSSLGGNVVDDGSCNPGADDDVVGDLSLGGLADNGGPTRTHLPAADSPLLDAADAERCPAIDQRGISRPQGAGCDAGSVEREVP